MKKLVIILFSTSLLALALSTSCSNQQESGEVAPSSVIHVVTVSWNAEATPEEIQAALDAVVTLANEFDGISRVWIRSIKAQGDRTHAFVMEFKSEQALIDYADSDAQKKWYESYIPARDASTTFDITN
jgi:hypothetical protein